MNTRRMGTGLRKYLVRAALAGVGLIASASLAVAQNTLSGGTVSGTAGQTVAVPITIDTGSNNVAFFAVTFTVVAQGGAPAITTAMTYTSSVTPGPDLTSAVAASGKLAIGYVGATLSPALSGTVEVGTLNVPIPAGATGSYDVQLAKISAGDSDGNKVTLTGVDGTITLPGGAATPTPVPTAPPTPAPNTLNGGAVNGIAGQTVAVPITLDTGSNNVAFFAVTFTVVAEGGAIPITTAMTYTSSVSPGPDLTSAVAASGKLAIGYVGATLSPPLSGTVEVGTLNVPIPDGSTGSYDVQLAKISAGDSDGNKVTLTGVDGTILLGTVVGPTNTPAPGQNTATPVPPTATAVPPTATAVPPTATKAAATATAVPATATKAAATATPTPTATPAPAGTAGFEEEGGCQIGAPITAGSGWLLLIPALGLVAMRRRRR